MSEKLQTIKTIDENGNELELQIVDIINFENRDFALLLPMNTSIEDEDAEVILMELKKTKEDEYIFEEIQDDEEFERIANEILGEEEE